MSVTAMTLRRVMKATKTGHGGTGGTRAVIRRRRNPRPTRQPAETLPLEVRVELPVRAYDVDFQGVVNNLVYVRWLEDLRFALLGRYLPLSEQVGQGFAPILASTQIEYKSPIRFGDRVVGRVWATEAKHVRCAVRCEIWAGDRLAAAATQTGCFVDLATLRPIPLPEPLRREFRRQTAQE